MVLRIRPHLCDYSALQPPEPILQVPTIGNYLGEMAKFFRGE